MLMKYIIHPWNLILEREKKKRKKNPKRHIIPPKNQDFLSLKHKNQNLFQKPGGKISQELKSGNRVCIVEFSSRVYHL